MVKKAIFFSVDALIASILILFALALIPVFYSAKQQSTVQPIYFSSDLIQLLSNIQIGEINETAFASLINSSGIDDMNRTILEQMLWFQIGGEEDKAEELLNLTIAGLIPDYYNVGVWVEGYEDPVFTTSQEPVTQLISSKEMVSGIEKSKAIEGTASRVLLSSISERTSSAFAYFGGYEGDGNITKKIFLPSDINDITFAYMELDAGSDFDLYINGVLSGHYNSSGNSRSDEWIINSSYLSNFNEGENTIKLFFYGSNEYIGGGYFKVDYSTSELANYEDNGTKRYYFPGIDGVINVYSSFYIPGNLNSMNIHLDGYSEYVVYLTIGNDVVFEDNLSGEVDITNEELDPMLDYFSLSNKTVPIRIGVKETNFSEADIKGWGVDVVLITDISGSMNSRLNSDNWGVTRDCSDPLLYSSSTKRISLSKCLNNNFIDYILSDQRNRVALSAFYGDNSNPYKGRVYEESLTNNATYLKQKVGEYSPQGGTCICCAINDAYKILDEESNESRVRFVVVMSDGIPTHTCQAASGCEGTRTGLPAKEGLWLGVGAGCYGGVDDCDSNDCECASQNANWSSCRVYNDLNATIYSIGFGPVASCVMANKTLKNIADCGNGEYYSSDNATILEQIYYLISEKILNITYKKQTAVKIGNITTTYLYPDSYIEFNYVPSVKEYEYKRIPMIIESPKFNNNITEGTFYIPDTAEVYDAKITSYSSDKWTDNVMIRDNGNWISFYNLSYYSDDYYMLGDPYIVNIPVELVKSGVNTVRIGTGINSINSTGGSYDDRAIYTIGIKIDINYTGIFEKADGCNWLVGFEDGTNTTIPVPPDYNGSKTCSFNGSTNCDIEYGDDAVDNSVCHLFKQLDFDGDGLLFVKIGANNLNTEIFSVGGVPYMWGPTIVDVRVWK